MTREAGAESHEVPAGLPRAGLAAKIRPPGGPVGTIRRPDLEARLADGLRRRLTIVVGGAGFGKSTLAAQVADGRPSAWYTLDAGDRELGPLATGLLAAIRIALPGLQSSAGATIETTGDPSDASDALVRAQAAAALVADALGEAPDGELLVVLDDLHVLDGAPAAWRFVEGFVRFAPPWVHVLLASRTELPFSVERLRGQGQVTDIGGPELVFRRAEIGILVADQLGVELDIDAMAGRLDDVTAGWPAAVRLAVEALRVAPEEERPAALERLRHPDGPIFSYLAEEVVSRAPTAVRELIRRAVLFDRFSADLCEAIGAEDADRTLRSLARRALFLQELPGEGEWYGLHALIREYTLAHLPLSEPERIAVQRGAAGWFEARGLHDQALAAWGAAGDAENLASFLDRRATGLVLGGATLRVVEAASRLPAELRTPGVERACGEAYLIRGEWRAAQAAFTRAAGTADRLDAATAWRMGLAHGLRGAYDEALAIYDRATLDGSEPADEALLFAWIASARAHRGDVDEARAAAERSVTTALAAGDQRAIAAAHTSLGMSYEIAGDAHQATAEYGLALAAAELAGDAIQIVRIRNTRGVLELETGRFAAALAELDACVRLAEQVGFAPFHARALTNRGRALEAVGRFEEALADFVTARQIYDRIGSPSVAYALVREGSHHLLRGDLVVARSAFETAAAAARGAADAQVLAPALIGLAQCVVGDDPDSARALSREALETGREVATLTVLLGAARVAVALDERASAADLAAKAEAVARKRRDGSALAEALEIGALVVEDRAVAAERTSEAAELWRLNPAPYGVARNRLMAARILWSDGGREPALEAERLFRSLGARGPAAEAQALVEELDRATRPAIAIQALGRFRILRDGEPIPPTAWQSKKARDLLKILVARRGRPTTRETIFELLWPDEDPGPLGNRLSVALATVRGVLDPERAYPPDQFVVGDKSSLSLDLEHVDLDVETFLADVANGRRLLRDGERVIGRASLERAEATYSGEFLEEDPYDDWAVGLREEVQAAYVGVARTLAELAAGDGDSDASSRYFLRILERDAYDEGAHLGLVAALVAAGRHGEARRRYGVYAAKMDEFGVEAAPFPSPSAAARAIGSPAA